MTTIQEHTAGTPSASDIESRICQLFQENRPAPTPIPENMLTREAADNLIKEALERQGAEHQRAVQEAIDRAAREARESSMGPSRDEIQKMIDQARRRRRGSTSAPNNEPPNLNQAGQIGTTPSGEPFVVKVSLPDRPIHRHISEPWLYSAGKAEDLKAWILSCEDYFNWNPNEWESEPDCIKYAISRLKDNSKAQEFGISYRRSMEGIDGYNLNPLYKYWKKFKGEIIERFEPKEGALLAKQEMDALRYKDDIAAYIDKIRTLNHRVGMSGITLRATIQAAIPQEIRLQLLYMPTTEDDDHWMKSVIEIGQTLEYGKQLEKLIKGENSNPKDKGKGKADRKYESKEIGTDKPKKPDLQDLKTGERFRRPSFGKTKTDAAQKEWKRMMGNIPQEEISKRKKNNACWRCGKKGHVAYACTEDKPIISAIRITRGREEDEEKEERPRRRIRLTTVPPKEEKKEGNSKGRIWELEEDEMEE